LGELVRTLEVAQEGLSLLHGHDDPIVLPHRLGVLPDDV
jgi:hypothetical protein